MWVLTTFLTAVRNAFNAQYPNRLKTSDGTIGDWEHQQGSSGHNPDDTPGSKSESTDADSKAEVRALDVDKDLLGPNTSREVMRAIILGIVANPVLRARFRYIIFWGRIWSASNGWIERAYSGDNNHFEHAHFSGNPDYDEDAGPIVLGVNMAGEFADQVLRKLDGNNALGDVYLRLRGPVKTSANTTEGSPNGWSLTELHAKVDGIVKDVNDIKEAVELFNNTPAPVLEIDYAKLAQALIAELRGQ